MKSVTKFISIFALYVFFNLPSANATLITVSPDNQEIERGNNLLVDVLISGLGDGVAPSLGTFDFDFFFNSTVLSLTNVTFWSGLDVLGLGSIQQFDSSTDGLINVFELSLDSPSDLDLLQPENFTLFQLTFSGVNTGTSDLALSVNSLGDALGNSVDFSIINSAVEVTSSPAPVPTPTSMLLFLTGLVGTVLIRKRKLRSK